MQKLLALSLLLFAITTANATVNEGNILKGIQHETVPFVPIETPLTKKNNKICKARALNAAYTFSKIELGFTVNQMIKEWNDFAIPNKDVSLEELYYVRNIIVLAGQIANHHTESSANDFGDWVYVQCRKEKVFQP